MNKSTINRKDIKNLSNLYPNNISKSNKSNPEKIDFIPTVQLLYEILIFKEVKQI